MRIFGSRPAILAWVLLLPTAFAAAADFPVCLDENHIQTASRVIRAGRDIGYYDENGNLRPADMGFTAFPGEEFAFRCEKAKFKIRLKNNLYSGWPIELGYRNKVLRLKPAGIYYVDAAAGIMRPVIAVNPGKFSGQANRVVYPNVFPGARLEFFLDERGLHQQFVFEKKPAVPAPQEKETHLALVTELDIDSLSPYRIFFGDEKTENVYYAGSVIAGEGGNVKKSVVPVLESNDKTAFRRLRFDLGDGDEFIRCFTFRDDLAEYLDTREHIHPKKILKKVDGRHYLFQLIPFTWLEKAGAGFSAGLDVHAGHYRDTDEIFLPGYTYVVEGRFVLKSLSSIGTPGNPVYVKYAPRPDSELGIVVEQGKGVKVDYTVFTSLYDNGPGCGETVDPAALGYPVRPPAPGDYSSAFYVYRGVNSYVTNSRFRYARVGIRGNAVDNGEQIKKIVNVLFQDCAQAAFIMPCWPPVFVNNTIRNCGEGAVVKGGEKGKVVNCVFAGNKIASSTSLDPGCSFNNVFFDNGSDSAEAAATANDIGPGSGLIDPFAAGTYGNCYLNDSPGGGLRLKDSGNEDKIDPEILSALHGMSTQPDGSHDTGVPDRGFHYWYR